LLLDAAAVAPTDPARQKADDEEAMTQAGAARDPLLEVEAISDAMDDADLSAREALMPVLRAAVRRGGETPELRRGLAAAETRFAILGGKWDDARAGCARTLALVADPQERARFAARCACDIPLQARDYKAALAGCQQAYDDARKTSGDDSPEAAELRRLTAAALERTGRIDDAIALLRDNVGHLAALYGDDSEELVTTLEDLGKFLNESRHDADARDVLVRALAILERTGRARGQAHFRVLAILANIDAGLDRSDDAVREIGEAVAEGAQFLGPDNPELATLLGNQGQVLSYVPAQRPAAHAAYQRAAAILQKTSPKGPMVALIEYSDAALLYQEDDYATALLMAKDALARFIAIGNPANVALGHRLLGDIYKEIHRKPDALVELEAARASYLQLGDAGKTGLATVDKRIAELR
jgi:tetratricopeptide (TPR) repeat protein